MEESRLSRSIRDENISDGLDHRHRDKNGHIAKKHGNTRIKTLRKIYGLSFAKGHPDDETLASLLHELDEPSLSKLIKDHEAGTLEGKIKEHA
jgi:hypothetical protein